MYVFLALVKFMLVLSSSLHLNSIVFTRAISLWVTNVSHIPTLTQIVRTSK